MTGRAKAKVIYEDLSEDQAGQLAQEYATTDAKIKQVTGQMEEEVNAVKEKYRSTLEAMIETQKTTFKRLELFAQKNDQLFEKKKSYKFLHATIGFRVGTPKVKLAKGYTWKAALQLLRVQLPDFIRTKEEANKEMIIANRNTEQYPTLLECGVTVVQDDTFYVDAHTEDIDN